MISSRMISPIFGLWPAAPLKKSRAFARLDGSGSTELAEVLALPGLSESTCEDGSKPLLSRPLDG